MMVHPAPTLHGPHETPDTRNSTMMLSSARQYHQRQTKHVTKSAIPESNYSTLAGKAIADGNYPKALEYYRSALNEYLNGSQTVVELVNAAATCFNLGALSKKLQNFRQAADYFCKAEQLYKSCSKKVLHAPVNDTVDESCEVCLFQLIVETIQARAHLHYKYQSWLDAAIECHEEVVDVLDQQLEHDRGVLYFKIRFTRLSKEDRWHLLMTSLQSLGKFYVERGDFEDGLVAYQEALGILKEQHSRNYSTKQRQDELTQIIKALSDIYMKKHRATMGVPELRRLAMLQEDLKCFGKALSCWERVLYLESQDHGEESVQVADALCQIARVMTAQGNHEGALDLYHAAIAKYQHTETPLPREAVGNTTNIFCQLLLHDDALSYLDDLLPSVQSTEEEAWIMCQRGRIFLEQGFLQEASQALSQGAKMFQTEDAYVYKLLQKLEFLQQRESASIRAISSTSLDMPLECILECDENSTITQEQNEETASREKCSKLSGPIHLATKMTERILETVEEQRQDGCITPDVDVMIGQATNASESVNSSTERSKIVDSSHDLHIRTGVVDDSVPSNNCNKHSGENSTAEGATSVKQPLTSIHKDVPLETLSGSSKLDRHIEKDRGCVRQRNGSKSTDETNQSTDSDPERRNLVLSTSPGCSKAAQENIPIHIVSDDESTSGDSCTIGSHPLVLLGDASAVCEQSDMSEKVSYIFDSSHQPKEDKRQRCKETNPLCSKASDVGRLVTGESKNFTTGRDPPVFTTNGHGCQLQSPSSHSNSSHQLKMEEGSNKDLSLVETVSSSNHSSQVAFERSDQGENAHTGKAQSRNRFVKALASPFRRSRSKKQLLAGGLDALDEERELKDFPAVADQTEIGLGKSASFDAAPISYIDMINKDEDDDDQSQVSQITFKWEEQSSQKTNQDGQWWWGVTAEGLEGWFPTAYVHQAVEAAEGFLSAKSIHDRVKSRPLDFDSDEESESDQDASSAVQSKHQPNSEKQVSNDSITPMVSDHSGRKISIESTTKPIISSEPLSAAESVRSLPSNKTSLLSQIEQKEAHLKEHRTSANAQPAATAQILYDLAVLRGKNGEIGAALNHLQHALQIQKATKSIADASKTLYLMAEMRSRAKQYQAALLCYAEAQNIQENIYGYYHEEIANILNRQGNVLARQGQFDQAMENHREALRILKECCGEEVKNPLVSQTLIQIGAVYYKERNSLKTIRKNRDGYTTFIESGMLEVIGRAHEDRGSYRMAIAFFEEKLQCLDEGENSKELEQVAETLNSLGMLSCRAGLYLEAIDYYDRALGIQMKLGCDDVQLAMAKVLAGSVQHSLGHFKKALKLFEDAFRTLRDKVGKEQETVAATLFHMGVVRAALYDFDEAMSNLKDAFKTQKKLLGNEHPATLRTRREIGNLCLAWTPELDTLLNEFNAILDIQKRIHGNRHPNIAETLHVIGITQARRGDHTLALRTLEGCYNMRFEFMGMDHPQQAATLHEIAKIRLMNGRMKKALNVCDSALHIRKESLGENHLDVATATATKASCLVARGNFTEATKLFLNAQAIAKEAVGARHPVIADIQVQTGTMHLRKCHFEEAASAINNALDIYRAYGLSEAHIGVRSALKELERVERAEMLCV